MNVPEQTDEEPLLTEPQPVKKRRNKILLITFYSLPVLIIIFFLLLNHWFNYPNDNVNPEEKRVWAHRGYVKDCQENSISSFQQAFDAGAAGIELDIFYLNNQFTVSHAKPDISKVNSLLKLETVFRDIGKRGRFWLDFKNLSELSAPEAEKAATQLRKLLDKYNLRSKVFVESINSKKLTTITDAGIMSVHWHLGIYKSDPVTVLQRNILYKIKFVTSGFSAISCDYRLYPKIRTRFPSVPLCLFAVNDKKIIKELLKDKQVKIILTDKKYYGMK